MFIKQIKICNLFAYFGEQTIDFERADGRNLYLVFGNNGFGKTSFIKCAKLLFNGLNLDDFDKPFAKRAFKSDLSYKELMMGKDGATGIVNKSALNSGQTSFFVEFSGDIRGDNFRLRRSWQNNNDWTESLELSLADSHHEGSEAAEMVGKILPKDFIDFFFFDGEAIRELSDSLKTKMREKISDILGITPLERLIKAAGDKKRELQIKEFESQEIQNQIKKNTDELENTHNDQRSHNDKLEFFRTEREQIQNEIKDLNAKINKIQVESSEESARLDERKNTALDELESQKEQITKNLRAILLQNDAFMRLIELLKRLENSSSSADIRALERLLPEIKEMASDLGRPVAEFLDGLPANLSHKITGELPIALDLKPKIEANIAEFRGLNLKENLESIVQNREKLRNLKTQIESISHDEEAQIRLAQLQDQVGEKENTQKQIDDEIATLTQFLTELKGKIKKIQLELNQLQGSDKTERNREQVEMLDSVINITNSYKTALLKRHKSQLQSDILAYYKKMISSDNIASLSISDDFEIDFYDANGVLIGLTGQSSGQNQILATAIFWAISAISERNIPFIIDTPLSRIDSTNRTNIIDNFYKNAASQVIMLPTDTEMTVAELEVAGPNIAAIYDIANANDRGHASIIKRSENGGF